MCVTGSPYTTTSYTHDLVLLSKETVTQYG